MTDRELLEMAAKAAGVEIVWPSIGDLSCRRTDTWDIWNPLTDDGDALRLAVRLQFTPHIDSNMTDCEGCTEASLGDPYSATRRAIVRAAASIKAEIGKAMP